MKFWKMSLILNTLGCILKVMQTLSNAKCTLKKQPGESYVCFAQQGLGASTLLILCWKCSMKLWCPLCFTAVRFGVLVKMICLDTVFLKFCKFLLGLKSCASSCTVYGELGCYPVTLTIQIRIISYIFVKANFIQRKQNL